MVRDVPPEKTIPKFVTRLTTINPPTSMSSKSVSLVWFTPFDLRIDDHEPLNLAVKATRSICPIFIFDPLYFSKGRVSGLPRTGPYRARFLFESVADLKRSLQSRGSDLSIRVGSASVIIPSIAKALNASAVFKHSEPCHEEQAIEEETSKRLGEIPLKLSWGAQTLYHCDDLPFDYKKSLPNVYTQFRRKVEEKCSVRPPLDAPSVLNYVTPPDGPEPVPFPCSIGDVSTDGLNKGSGSLPSLEFLGASNLCPLLKELNADAYIPSYGNLGSKGDHRSSFNFVGGETAAKDRLKSYLWETDSIKTYKETRNGLLGPNYSTKFSAFLSMGNISARRIFQEIKEYESRVISNESTYWVLFEILWRDYFNFYARFHGARLFFLYGPRNDRSSAQVWGNDKHVLSAWALGQTGFPFVDANMRELLLTGFQSNRGRQNVASFLVKDACQDWRLGAELFESLLIDHDPASNFGNWTYVAGVGADPREDRYFLIPKQSKTYDVKGDYIRHWLPELSLASTDSLHNTNLIGDTLRRSAKYPSPILVLLAHRQGRDVVDHRSGGGGGGRGGGGGGGGEGGGGRGGGGGGGGGRGGGGGGGQGFSKKGGNGLISKGGESSSALAPPIDSTGSIGSKVVSVESSTNPSSDGVPPQKASRKGKSRVQHLV